MSREKQIESTDWLTRDIPKEQLEREKQEAIMSADLELCHAEFISGIYTDYDAIAQKMFAKGWRKQIEGEWLFNRGRTYGEPAYYCSNCSEGGSEYGYDKFCPNCGAKMKGGESNGR